MNRYLKFRCDMKDDMRLLWLAAIMCPVMSLLVVWATANLTNPSEPDLIYLPRQILYILMFIFWLLYVIFEICNSKSRFRWLWMPLCIVLPPLGPILYAFVNGRNIDVYKKSSKINSDGIFNAFCVLIISPIFLLIASSFIFCPCEDSGAFEFLLLYLAFFYLGLLFFGSLELMRVALPARTKIKWLILAFTPFVPIAVIFIALLLPVCSSFDKEIYLIIILVFIIFIPFYMLFAMGAYIRRYMSAKTFLKYHSKE